MVRRGHAHAAGLGYQSEGAVHASRGRRLVVLHSHHHLVVHRQLGGLPHRRKGRPVDNERRGAGQSDQNQVRHLQRRLNYEFLQGKLRAFFLADTSIFWHVINATPKNGKFIPKYN